MKIETRLTLPADHPALAGHFPGNPLFPGVVLLEAVEEALAGAAGAGYVAGIEAVKFVSPARPGEPVILEAEEIRPGQFRFRCLCNGTLVAEGRLTRAATAS